LYLAPLIGDAPARRLSVLTGVVLIFLITLATVRWLDARRTGQLLWVGAMWVVLTIAFEVALGRLVFHMDWARIASDYDPGHGGLMGIGLVCMLFTPLMAARLRLSSDELPLR
jgi:hypothetical protein